MKREILEEIKIGKNLKIYFDMNNPEDKQLNQPTRDYFKKKMKCPVARTEFSFFAGKLDVLAYNQEEKCFHISEGKRSKNVASVGHAIGQLISYMTMIQERGYDFLDRISKEEKLNLSDFSTFLENKAIRVCFYITLPIKDREKLMPTADLMLKNLGDFGSSIGIFFADSQKCELVKTAEPLFIKIRKKYTRNEFLAELRDRFIQEELSKGLVYQKSRFEHLLQFKEKSGNPYLHFEIWAKRQKKNECDVIIEIAFHLEFAKAHLEMDSFKKRKRKLQGIMNETKKLLEAEGEHYKFQSKWGKNWSRLYTIQKIHNEFNQDYLSVVLERFNLLVGALKPKLDKIKWGRIK